MSQSESGLSLDSVLDEVDRVDPAEAFQLIANETRLEILQALAEADDRPVSFSTLRKEVGMRDSAQFNYHLQQLTGQFVTQCEEGYAFKHAGEKVVRAITAGSFTEDPQLEPFEVQGACVACGGPLQATYHDERMRIECGECGRGHGEYGFPPGGLHDRTLEEVAQAFDNRVRHLHCLAADGVCPECGGRIRTTIDDADCCLGVDLHVDHVCPQCGHELCSAPGLRLLDHSAVVTFHRERGINLDTRPYWTLPWCVSDEHTRLLQSDPIRLEVQMEAGEDTLAVEMDETLSVVDTTIHEGDR